MSKENSFPQPTSEKLTSMAPLELPNYREDRFRGDSNRSHLTEQEDADRKIFSRIYQELQNVFEEMQQGQFDPKCLGRVLTKNARRRDLIAADTRQLGVAPPTAIAPYKGRINFCRSLEFTVQEWTEEGAVQVLLEL